MNKNFNKMTLTEFRNIENFIPTKPFKDIILVPMPEVHESGFRCMKFILTNKGEIVGAVSGWSDVIHLNGTGGFGRDIEEVSKSGKVDRIDWRIDCLTRSKCMRLFTDVDLELDDGFIGSDFIVYKK